MLIKIPERQQTVETTFYSVIKWLSKLLWCHS